jgi:hypothetical protein
MDTILVQAKWRNPETGSEYTAEYKVSVDKISKLYCVRMPDKRHCGAGAADPATYQG